jgi:hypothetical protein
VWTWSPSREPRVCASALCRRRLRERPKGATGERETIEWDGGGGGCPPLLPHTTRVTTELGEIEQHFRSEEEWEPNDHLRVNVWRVGKPGGSARLFVLYPGIEIWLILPVAYACLKD